MESSPAMQPARPLSVKELVAQAENFRFNTNIPFKQWAHAAETLCQEASFALSDGDYARSYTMLYRHSVLVLKLLPTHPRYKEPDSQKAFKSLSKRIGNVLKDLEQLKPEIERAYNEWERMKPPTVGKAQVKAVPGSYANFAARDPSLAGHAKILDASEHQELAVDLAQKEITRRDTARRATRQAGLSDEEALARRRAGTWDNWERSGLPTTHDVDLQRQMEATRRTLDSVGEERREASTSSPVAQHYSYPTISKSQPVSLDRPAPDAQASLYDQPRRPLKEPVPPPRDEHSPFPSRPDLPSPLIPRKVPLEAYQPLIPESSLSSVPKNQPRLPPKESLATPPLPRKERLTFKPGAYLENGDPIRSVFIPSQLRRTFLDIAADNTKRNLEMCGLLCGTAVNNALFIRCLLIPEQISTSDTCETINESAYFDYVMSEDLIVIGWIHTHPTQTCFMSSRDLHTHAGYQHMMPESVAIVCAPRHNPSYGVFRLTHPPGLDHVLNCQIKDTFHQHSVANLYTEAEQPQGHVYESDKLPFYVHDLRPK